MRPEDLGLFEQTLQANCGKESRKTSIIKSCALYVKLPEQKVLSITQPVSDGYVYWTLSES